MPHMPAERFLLDSGVYDPLLERPDVVAALLRLIGSGQAALLVTHVQRTQVPRGSDSGGDRQARRSALFDQLLAVSEEVQAGIFMLNVTPLGDGKWASDELAEAFDRNLRTRRKHLGTRTGIACDVEESDGPPLRTRYLDQVSCAECRDLIGIPVTDLLRYRDSGDATLIETARVEGATFVTRESTGRAPNAADRQGVPRLTVAQFFAWVLGRT